MLKTHTMTPEEKDLLLKDICARLPYKVQVLYRKPFGCVVEEDECELTPEIVQEFMSNEEMVVYPYLRPMSSMTEEEHNVVHNLLDCFNPKNELWMLTDFLDKRMLDHRHLIEKRLALEAPEGMYT